MKIEEKDHLLKLSEGGDTQGLGHLQGRIVEKMKGIKEKGVMTQGREEGFD